MWFHVVQKTGEMLEEITWSFRSESESIFLLRVNSGPDSPTLSFLQDKIKGRIQVPNMMSLKTENLISQDSGQYQAQVRDTSGLLHNPVFQLSVYGKWLPLSVLWHSSCCFCPGKCPSPAVQISPGNAVSVSLSL